MILRPDVGCSQYAVARIDLFGAGTAKMHEP
jgi:hypothetical protein